MPEAVGVVQMLGMPAALAVADEMVKGARVEFVRYDNTDAGLINVIVRGAIADVQASVQTGIAIAHQQHPRHYAGHHVIPCPDGNVEAVLALMRSPTSESGWLD